MLIKSIDCFFVFILSTIVSGQEKVIIGGFFEDDDPSQKAFNVSIDVFNRLREISTDELPNIVLEGRIFSSTEDILQISENVCDLVENGVAAIFGPHNKFGSAHVQSMCDTMDIPNIIARWDSDTVKMQAINLYPHADTFSEIFLHLVTDFNWKKFTILYDKTDGLIRMNKLLKRWDPKGHTVTIRHLGNGPNFRDILKKVKNSGEKNIVIDCAFEILEQVLLQSQQVGLLSDRHKIIVSSLDFQILNLEPFQHTGVNFTGIRLINPEEHDLQEVQNQFLNEMGLEDLSKMPLNSALIYDAIQLFVRAFKQFEDGVNGHVRSFSCQSRDSWEHGTTVNNFLRSVEMNGLTGLIKFHTSGFRTDFQVDIIRLSEAGLYSIGLWNSTNGIQWKPDSHATVVEGEEDLANRTFIVSIALVDPYNMLKESSTMRTGNDRYEGFAIDIIHELSKLLHFNYTFVEQVDKDYGSPNADGEWSGMIGKIRSGEADLAITDLSITASRETAVDFTMPFMNLGISILFITPKKAAPSLFSFLSPFSDEVWLYIIGAYTLTSLVIFFIGRISAADWNNPYPCIEEPTELENQFTYKNTPWFTLGPIMLGGTELAPAGNSTRLAVLAWWFFALIITNSYTANLAAFLTVETSVKPIKSAEDLANLNGKIKYGAKTGGATYLFFKAASYAPYLKMYQYMEENKNDVMFDDNDKGRKRVLADDGKYAFLMESSSIQYIAQRNCDLTQIGGLLDAKGYGIAMRKGFRYRHKLNEAVLQIQETGILSQLQTKWWKEKRGGGKCTDVSGSSQAAELTLDNVGGVFVVLAVGLALSFVFSVLEMLYDLMCKSLHGDLPFRQLLLDELHFIIKFKGTTKPAQYHHSSANNTPEESSRENSPTYSNMPAVVTNIYNKKN